MLSGYVGFWGYFGDFWVFEFNWGFKLRNWDFWGVIGCNSGILGDFSGFVVFWAVCVGGFACDCVVDFLVFWFGWLGRFWVFGAACLGFGVFFWLG